MTHKHAATAELHALAVGIRIDVDPARGVVTLEVTFPTGPLAEGFAVYLKADEAAVPALVAGYIEAIGVPVAGMAKRSSASEGREP